MLLDIEYLKKENELLRQSIIDLHTLCSFLGDRIDELDNKQCHNAIDIINLKEVVRNVEKDGKA